MVEHYSHRIQNVIQKELFKAQRSIKIAVAWFTNDLLFQPLLLKLQTGVSVELILNKDDTNCSDKNDVDFSLFVGNGGLLHWNTTKQLMHDKFCIIDDIVVIKGSYNWTNKAEFNVESIEIFREEQGIVNSSLDDFKELCSKYPAEISEVRTSLNRLNSFVFERGELVLDMYDVLVYRWIINEKYVYRIFSKENRKQICLYDFDDILIHPNPDVTAIGVKQSCKWHFYSLKDRDLKLTAYNKIEAIKNDCRFWIYQAKLGVANSNGVEQIKCKYDDITVFNSIPYCIIKKDGKYGLAEDIYYEIDPCVFDEIVLKNGWFLYRIEDKWGVEDQGGIWVVEPEYDEIEPVEPDYGEKEPIDVYFIVRIGKHKGVVTLLDRNIACEYDDISYLGNKRFLVNKKGFIGLYDNDQFIIPCEYDELKPDGYSVSFKKGKAGVLSEKGDVVVDFNYTQIHYFHFRDIPYNHGFYLVYNEPYYGIWQDNHEVGRIHESTYAIQKFIPEFNLFRNSDDPFLEEMRNAIIRSIYEIIVSPAKTYKTKPIIRPCLYGEKVISPSKIAEMKTRVVQIAVDNKFQKNDKRDRWRGQYTEKVYDRYGRKPYDLGLEDLKFITLDCMQCLYTEGDIIHIYKNSPVIQDKIQSEYGESERRYIIVKIHNPSSNSTRYASFNPWDLKRRVSVYDEKTGRRSQNMFPNGTAVDLCKNMDDIDEMFNALTHNRTQDCKIRISKVTIATTRNYSIKDYCNAYLYTYDLYNC